jgi:hypothetical protein
MIRTNSIAILVFGYLVFASAVGYASPRHTSFNPDRNGFNFANTFQNDFVREFDIRTGGLCGGMVYTALDYYFKHRPIPHQNYRPAVQTPLHDYVYDRQVNSLADNLDKWAEVGFNPGGARDSEFFIWGLRGFNGGRLQELRSKIDRGQPVPLGLQSYGGDGRPGNHQVLAIGYDMGRYRGDLKSYKTDLKIYIYDPNYPNRTMTLRPDLTRQGYYYQENHNKLWRTYFVDMKYRAHNPPRIAAAAPSTASDGLVRQLLLTIKTGGDDLRGRNDNVNVTVNYRGEPPQHVNNINGGRRWIDNYSQTVPIRLSHPVPVDRLASVVLTTTFSGGIGGDNWNMDALKIEAHGGVTRTLYERSAPRPLYRFTGSRRSFTALLH